MVYITVFYADLRSHTNVNILQSLLAWKETPYLLAIEHHLLKGADILQTFHHPAFLLDTGPPMR